MTLSKRLALVAATSLVLAGTPILATAPAQAHETGIHDNCTNLNERWPHGVGRRNATDDTSGEPVTNFKRSNKKYKRAVNHNSDLDRDNDKIACEKH